MANFKFLETEYQLKKLKPKYNNFWYAGKIKGYWCIVSTNFYENLCSIMIGAHKEDTHKSLVEILNKEIGLKKVKIKAKDATKYRCLTGKTHFTDSACQFIDPS